MKNLMKKTIVMLAIAAVAFSFISCGGSKSSASSTAAAPAAASTTAPAKTAADVANIAKDTSAVAATTALTDQTINIGYGTAIDSLTPFRSNTGRNCTYLLQLYEALGYENSDNEIVPWVAKSWTTPDNGFTYDIEIYDNIKDSAGNQIKSSDIVWFIQEAQKRALKPVFAKIAEVKTTGDYTLQLKLKSNIVGTFESLMMDTFVVSEKAFKESKDEFATSCVSTSAYVVKNFVSSASIDYERRADYWQDIEKLPEGLRPLAKNVNYKIITEAFQLGVALETGVVDAVIDLAASTGKNFTTKQGFTVDLSDGPQGWQVFFSGADSSLVANNEKLRQAIAYAIDEQGMVTAVASGFGTQMWDVASPRLIGFNPEWKNQDYYNFNLEKAKQLVAESGYKGEELVLLSTSSAMASRLGQLIQGFCKAVGINIKINAVDMALYSATRLDGTKYDLTINTVGGTSLADQWSIRFDPAAYKAGDATSRKDQVLGEMLYKTWTAEGWTKENIDAVHNYIKDHCYAYGMVNPSVFTIWNNNINMTKVVKGGVSGYVMFPACQFNK